MTDALIDVLLGFALIVVVPLSLGLRGAAAGHVKVAMLAGCVASGSFFFPRGPAAAALAAVWVLVPVSLLPGIRLSPTMGSREGLGALPVAFLLVGVSWLVLSRYGARPLGFSDHIVELTAVHFHYAGFVAPTLIERLARWLEDQDSSSARVVLRSQVVVLMATPVTAMGITFAPAAGSVGALMFAAGLVTYSAVILREVRNRVPRATAIALTVSSLSVIVTMLLAVAYASGRWLGTPAPSLQVMVWTHGILNAFGFAFAGALGWFLYRSDAGAGGTSDEENPLDNDYFR